jgi:NodT family efflux transporter outer membrane factor (OMF) lipoprotein
MLGSDLCCGFSGDKNMADMCKREALVNPSDFRRVGRLWMMLLVSAMLLSGCAMIGPDFFRPSSKLSPEWLDAGDPRVKTEPTTYRDWWKAFSDLVLDDLIQTAYRQNLSLRITGVRVLEARAQLGIAIGEFFPQSQQLLGSENYNRTSQRSSQAVSAEQFPAIGFAYNQAQIGFSANWELDFWGKFRRAIQSADASLLSFIAAYDSALVTLTGDVASTYVTIRTLEDRLRIARENVETQNESLKIAQARFEGGATSERDVQQALTQLNSTEATIPQLETLLRQQLNALSTLLGLPPGDLGERLSGASGIPSVPMEVSVSLPADLLRRRPDIRSAEYQAAAQCAQIGVAKADLFPAFSLSGNFGLLATDIGQFKLGDVTSWRSRTGSIGPAFQWNVLNYGQITNNVRLQDARFQELIVSYQNTVLQAQKEVENGLVSFLKAQERVGSLVKAVNAAKRTVDLSVIQYREGATDYTTVLTAQKDLLSQQDNLAQGQGDIPQGLISVYRAFGGGWEIREGHDFVPAEIIENMQNRTNWGSLFTPAAAESPSAEGSGSLIRAPEW